MTKTTRQLCEKALWQLRGDDLERARAAFRNCTEEQMNQQYGESGQTRLEVLRGYEEHVAKVEAALAEVKSL